MAGNLNYEAEGSKCIAEVAEAYYRNLQTGDLERKGLILSSSEIQTYCNQYGKLYDWKMAKEVCPSGWHLPSNEEWQILVDFAGGYEVAGEKLKTKNGWLYCEDCEYGYNGTNDFGFSALPGSGCMNERCEDVGKDGYWWSATEGLIEDSVPCAYYWRMKFAYSSIYKDCNYVKSTLFSVRCLQD